MRRIARLFNLRGKQNNNKTIIKTGYNCIQNFQSGGEGYIVGYTVGNLVLHRRVSGAKT